MATINEEDFKVDDVLFKSLMNENGERKIFGFLEQPSLPPSFEHAVTLVPVKVSLFGKAGVGKSSLVAKLCGYSLSDMYSATLGYSVSSMYWPIKVVGSQNPFRLLYIEFWDAGTSSFSQYDYIKPALVKNATVCLFCFSFTDKNSLDTLSHLIDGVKESESKPITMVVGTKWDANEAVISSQDISEFESTTNITVIHGINIKKKPSPRVINPFVEIKDFMDKFVAVLSENDHSHSRPKNWKLKEAF